MPCVSSVPLVGFGYPFSGLSDLKFLESDICFQRSWVSLSKAFFLSCDRKGISPSFFPFLHFYPNPQSRSLVSVLQRFAPTRKAVPLLSACSEFDVKAGGICSLKIYHLPGSPPLCPPLESSPFQVSPFHCSYSPPCGGGFGQP